MDTREVVELLKQDMMGEHQAIIQYLSHAYAMGEGEMAGEIEAIAREEMRHLDWLADAIVELGGDPSLERSPVDFGAAAVEAQMRKNVILEQMAIDQYRAHMDAIADEHLRRLLARIVHDEMAHQEQFTDLAQEAREEASASAESGACTTEAGPSERLSDILNYGIRHEYTVVLQYLFHSFVAEDKELAEELQNAAINEMQHMGWLSEELAGEGGSPDMSHTELFLSHDHEKNLQADIAVEREVTQAYSSQIPEIEDEGLQKLVTRIRDHEIYHDALFSDLLEEVREETEGKDEAREEQEHDAGPKTIPSVGSLKGAKQ